MSNVVQAKCPFCQNVLRIPAEWLAKPMRCKRCKNTFQAKNKSTPPSEAAVTAAPVPKARPASAPSANPSASAPAEDSFEFSSSEILVTTPMRRRKKGNGLLFLVILFFFLFLGGAGAAGVVLFKIVTQGTGWLVHNDASGDLMPRPGELAQGGDERPPRDRDLVDKKGPKDLAKKDGKKTPVFTNDPFPRRALLISVNNYLMFNTVHYGSPTDSFRGGFPGSSTGVLRERLTKPPMYFPNTQVIELSDAVPADSKTGKAHPTQRSVIETSIQDFIAGCREQDRIVVLFAGHAASIEDKSYLVPIDGNLKKPESLLPLKWVYGQLEKCKAQQKVLILDVCRFSPSRGFELPSAGEGEEGKMPEVLDKDLLNPPAGVQVWSSCIKDQNSVELDGGSAFLQALCGSLQASGAGMKGIATASDPIPVEFMVEKANERLKELAGAEKRAQVSRLSGKQAERVVDYNRDEPLPAQLALKPPVAVGGEAAGAAAINGILDDLKPLPPVRETRAGDVNLLNARNLPIFPAKKIDTYKSDGTVADMAKKYKANEKEFVKDFPLRAAYLDALDALQDSKSIKMRETLTRADTDPKRKAAFLLEQEPLSVSIFKLEGVLLRVKAAVKQRDQETSRRWQANFDYTHARVLSRLIYLYEYNYTLGQIRADNLPELTSGQSGWRVGITGAKINVSESKAKNYVKETKNLWNRLQEEYPDTPWALLAERESMIALGLAWRPKSD